MMAQYGVTMDLIVSALFQRRDLAYPSGDDGGPGNLELSVTTSLEQRYPG